MISCRQFDRTLETFAELAPTLVEIPEASVVEFHRGNDRMPYFCFVHPGMGEFQTIEGQSVFGVVMLVSYLGRNLCRWPGPEQLAQLRRHRPPRQQVELRALP